MTSLVDGYCFKCKAMRQIRNGKEVVLKNGKKSLQGTCVVCNTKVTRFVKS